MKYFTFYQLCETAFLVCLKRKEENSWVLWFVIKKKSVTNLWTFCVGHRRKFYKCSDHLLGAYLFPSPQMIQNFFINHWVNLIIANLCLLPSLPKAYPIAVILNFLEFPQCTMVFCHLISLCVCVYCSSNNILSSILILANSYCSSKLSSDITCSKEPL